MENLLYRTLFNYSINYGTNAKPFDPIKENFSVLSEFHYRFPQKPTFMLKTKLAADFGTLYGPNFAVMLTILKIGGL